MSKRVADIEAAVCSTSKGKPWLVEAQETVLESTERRLTLAGRARAVKTVEGRLRVDLTAREEAVGATSAGAALLRKEYGAGGVSGAALLQSFAAREDVLDRIEERVDAELETREEELRWIPLGQECLREGEQARPGGVAGPLPLVDRESMINVATKRVEEEFDKREKGLAARAGHENLLVEVTGDLGLASGTLTLGERWRAIESAERWVEAEDAEFEVREAAILEDPAGAVFLSDARREILGDREATTLADRGRVIQAAEAALQKAEAKRQADQEWEEKKAVRERALARLPGGTSLYHAHLAEFDPQWSLKENNTTSRENIDSALTAAESDGARQERLRVVLSDEAAAARYREVLDDSPDRFKTSALDRALAAGEREREEREAARRVALETATEAAQVAAARSNVKLPDAHVQEIYETGKTHAAGLAAVERTIRALDDAANQRLPADMVIDTWNAYRSEPGGIAAGLDAATTFARRRKAERDVLVAARVIRLEQLLDKPASAEAFIAALDDEDPSWRTGTHPACIDQALDVAERGLGRRKADTWRHQQHELVLKAEQQFPGIPSAAWRDAGGSFRGQTAIDRHGESVSRMLSDRACARALAAEEPSAEPEPARNLVQVTDWLRTEVERQQLEALRARTGAARLSQRNHNSVTAIAEKAPPVAKPDRLVPDATWEDAEPLIRTLADMENAPARRRRLDQLARHAVTAIAEKAPPVAKPARRVPEATREDAVAAAPLIVRARLPEAAQQELRLGVDIVARELAGENFQWWSHAGSALDELHSREDRYLAINDTKESPVEIGMLRTVLEKDVYEKAFLLVEHPAAEPDPPKNLGALVRAFIERLQDAVDRLIDRVLGREPAHPSRLGGAADQVPARPVPKPPAAVPPAAEPARRGASPPPDTAPAPEPALIEAERVRVAVDAVKARLPWTQPYSHNRSYRPPAVSDKRFAQLAAATDDEFVKMVVTELQRRQTYYSDDVRSESEKTHLSPAIERRHKKNLEAYEKAEAERRLFSRRQPKPTWAEAKSAVITEFAAEQLAVIEDVCRDIQQWSPQAVRHKPQRLEPTPVTTVQHSRLSSHPSSHTKQQDRGDTSWDR